MEELKEEKILASQVQDFQVLYRIILLLLTELIVQYIMQIQLYFNALQGKDQALLILVYL
jgi:hypothetical protein